MGDSSAVAADDEIEINMRRPCNAVPIGSAAKSEPTPPDLPEGVGETREDRRGSVRMQPVRAKAGELSYRFFAR